LVWAIGREGIAHLWANWRSRRKSATARHQRLFLKIGDGLARSTADSPGRDPIVARIIWLRGCEPQNANAFVRDIYIHETPEERNIGLPVSYGCVRMRSSDIVNLFDIVGGKQMITATYGLAGVLLQQRSSL
jgi:hypothetical protein